MGDPVLCDWGSGRGAFRLLHCRWWRKKQGKSDAVLSFVSFQSLKRHTCSVVKLRRKAPSGEKQQQGAHQKAKQSKEEQRKEKKRKYDSYNQPTNKPANQPANQPTSQPASQSTNQPTNRPTDQPANQP